ncbi:MAG: HlyD family type I secretion periplasmic adaptor subunit [Amaricoccus sp.]
MSTGPTNRWGVSRLVLGGYVVIATLVFGIGAWAAVARISGAVIVPGVLEVEGNRQVVQHPNGGVISAIKVKDGDIVKAGDVLIELEGDDIISNLGIVEGQWFEILAREGRLDAERDGLKDITFSDELTSRADDPAIAKLMTAQRQQFAARAKLNAEESSQLAERESQIQQQIVGMQSVQVATREQMALLSKEIDAQQQLLDQGLTQISRLLALQRNYAELKGNDGQIDAGMAENRGKIAEIEINRVQIDSKTREDAITELRDLEFREIELREKRMNLKDQVEKLLLRAPVGGVVYGNTADTLRGVIRPAEPIMYIVPADAPLIVRGHVQPTSIDQVQIGQQAVLRFSAFDARTTPEISGHVQALSADAIEDKARGTRYYNVDIQIDAGGREKLVGRKLLPGMPVEAFIGTDERSPLSYFVKPFTDYFSRAFQEG